MNPQFESILLEADTSFNLLHFGCDSFASDHMWHYHPEYELTWIVRSSGTRFVGNSIKPYDANDLVLIGPGLPHCWHNDETAGAGERPELFLVQFSESFLGDAFFALPEARAVREMFRQSACGLCFPPAVADEIGCLLRKAAELGGLERIAALLAILAKLAASPRETLASADYQTINDISPANRERIETVHRHVRSNLYGEICQAELASQLKMTPQAFSKFFRAATGHTFVGFVNILRINEACRLLAGTDRSITQVAMDCGYNNISNFNRQFLQLKGTTPSNFRRGGAILSDQDYRDPASRGALPRASRFRPSPDSAAARVQQSIAAR
ncbi:MAG: AraC family transcriptional regulator [Alphaproteobacteria bacterium HGW-Alphaproteobacteria-5]|jgi:AraC-like DNA-binding protein|nr:MAG: AraC family transcriptional regulator [Alphaproteobacteria bacterium HGW-Alphaproteobacteria-5]